MERKLAAIFSADVKGYSRLMGDNEEATIRTLTAYRQVMTTLIQQHRGRVVDSPGDNLLAEFASAVDAVQGAVAIQQELKVRNADLPAHRWMEFRIGINVGDVVTEAERLYGDGVNIAARLEGLAEPGGICISGTVHDHVENKLLVLQYEDLGEQTVKNIAKPVRVWRVVMEDPSPLAGEGQGEGASDRARTVIPPHPDLPPQGGKEPKNRRPGIAHRAWVIAAGLALIVGVLVTVRYLSPPTLSPQSSSLVTQEAQPPSLPLPDKPSIAVLPFVNMSDDPEQEYFSDGITEDLITDLSKISGLFVIARNSTFFYKGKAVKVADISRELGVRYVREGSVRKAGDQVRITAQLVDATTGNQLWAERYDRPLKDIFALQDEIRQKIVTTLKLQLTLWEQGFLTHKSTDSPEAYDAFLRGIAHYWRFTREANVQARQMWERAIELDPQYAEAYAYLGRTYTWEWSLQWNQDPQALEQAFALAQKAVALDESMPSAHQLLGQVYLFQRQHQQAVAEAERAVALAPTDAEGYLWLGWILNYAGRPEEGITKLGQAMRLNPQYPANYSLGLGQGYRVLGRYEEAIAAFKKALGRNSNLPAAYLGLAATYSELGQEEEAQATAAELLRINPNFSLELWVQRVPFKDQAVSEHYVSALRKAGLK
jgi:adenylate cyclase